MFSSALLITIVNSGAGYVVFAGPSLWSPQLSLSPLRRLCTWWWIAIAPKPDPATLTEVSHFFAVRGGPFSLFYGTVRCPEPESRFFRAALPRHSSSMISTFCRRPGLRSPATPVPARLPSRDRFRFLLMPRGTILFSSASEAQPPLLPNA